MLYGNSKLADNKNRHNQLFKTSELLFILQFYALGDIWNISEKNVILTDSDVVVVIFKVFL